MKREYTHAAGRDREADEIERLRAENEHLHKAHQAACEGGDLLRAEIERLTRERDEARAEVERLRRHVDALQEKVRAESCACGYDSPDAVCLAHSPQLMAAGVEIERLRADKEDLYASIAGIERAAAGAIYSQESIHAMALYALKPLMERGIEALEAKP